MSSGNGQVTQSSPNPETTMEAMVKLHTIAVWVFFVLFFCYSYYVLTCSTLMCHV